MSWVLYFFAFGSFFLVYFILNMVYGENTKVELLSVEHTNAVKGLAIILVMLGHSMQKFAPEISYFTPTGGIGVCLFLFCSGYGLNESSRKRKETWQYWYKRLITVIIPYAIFEIITFWSVNSFDLKLFFLDILCIKPLYSFGWYLSYLMLWYVVFFILNQINLKNSIGIMLIISACVFVFSRSLVAEQAVSFVLGVYISINKDKFGLKASLKNGILLLACGIMMLAIKQIPVVRESPDLIYKAVQLSLKALIAMAFIILSFQVGKFISLESFQRLGLISFELYLIHGIVLGVVKITYIGMLIFVTASIAIAWIFHLMTGEIKRRAIPVIKEKKEKII